MNPTDPIRRQWLVPISLAAAVFACCLGLVTLISCFQNAGRMGYVWRPGIVQAVGMLVYCLVLGAGLYFAVLAHRRKESAAGARICCFACNGLFLVLGLLVGAVQEREPGIAVGLER